MTRVWRDGLIIGAVGLLLVGLCVFLVSKLKLDANGNPAQHWTQQ